MSGSPDEAFGPQVWMMHAESSLIRGRVGFGVAGIILEDLCFDAQQAAEKALKALLVTRSVRFPKTHALAELLTLLDRSGVAIPEKVQRATELTTYAVRTRYPGGPRVIDDDYQAAMTIAQDVLTWVKRELATENRPS